MLNWFPLIGGAPGWTVGKISKEDMLNGFKDGLLTGSEMPIGFMVFHQVVIVPAKIQGLQEIRFGAAQNGKGVFPQETGKRTLDVRRMRIGDLHLVRSQFHGRIQYTQLLKIHPDCFTCKLPLSRRIVASVKSNGAGKSRCPRPGRPKDSGLAVRRRSQIVQHAIEEFARHGYTGADLDVIAAAAGCSKGTLYNYFTTKGDLFSAAVDHVMFNMVAAMGVEDDGEAIAQLEQMVHGFLRYFAEHPQYVELLAHERSDFRDRQEPTFYRYRAVSRQQWKKKLARLMAQGLMRPMPADQIMNIFSDLLYGTILMNRFHDRHIKPERQAADVLAVMFGGLLTEAGLRARKDKRNK